MNEGHREITEVDSGKIKINSRKILKQLYLKHLFSVTNKGCCFNKNETIRSQ